MIIAKCETKEQRDKVLKEKNRPKFAKEPHKHIFIYEDQEPEVSASINNFRPLLKLSGHDGNYRMMVGHLVKNKV